MPKYKADDQITIIALRGRCSHTCKYFKMKSGYVDRLDGLQQVKCCTLFNERAGRQLDACRQIFSEKRKLEVTE